MCIALLQSDSQNNKDYHDKQGPATTNVANIQPPLYNGAGQINTTLEEDEQSESVNDNSGRKSN